MNLTRIYQSNPYIKDTVCEVVKIDKKGDFALVSTDKTVFFPEGGGQPSDVGTITLGEKTYNVTYATDKTEDGAIFLETDAKAGTFSTGDEVVLRIDWDARFINMQRHCGEHMLSGAIHKLYGGVNKGFHMGEDYIAIDIDLDGKLLTANEVAVAEAVVNMAIRDNLPVEIKVFDSYEESRVMPVRKDVPHDGQVTVVVIGDEEDPFDCIACCGTHPATTAEVGMVAIYKTEANKGMTRIYFDCGKRAFDKLKKDYQTLTTIANNLSTSNDGVIHKLEVQAEREQAFKVKLSELSAFYKDKESCRIISEIEEMRESCKSKVYAFENTILDANDLLKLGFSVSEILEDDELLVLNEKQSNTVILVSKGACYKCGDIARKIASNFGGRGGGRPDNARIAFEDQSSVQSFIEHISNVHYEDL